jgi:hypothetical protein
MSQSRPVFTLRRACADVALLLTFVYVLILTAGVFRLVQDGSIPVLTACILIIPAAAFGPAAFYAIALYRTRDPDRMKVLWQHCAVYALSGLALLIADGVILSQVSNP